MSPARQRLALAGMVVGALAFALAVPTYPNYDSYFHLNWGRELLDGQLPNLEAYAAPTQHPLLVVLCAALDALLGGAADRGLVVLCVLSLVVLVAAVYRVGAACFGVGPALGAALFTGSSFAFLLYASRGYVDVPFLALVFGAAVLELSRPRRGGSVLVLLGLAGLLRPEAWVLAGIYVLWLTPAVGFRGFVRYGLMAAAAPVGWALADLVVTGDPLYSLTSTREVAGQFGRQRSPLEALLLLPDFLGGNEKIVNVAAGGLGGVLATVLLRRRAALPLALALVGMAVFLAIAAVGLSVIPRYLLIPSLVFNMCVAAALVGWTLARDRRVRAGAIALAVLALALVAFRTPSYARDFAKLNAQAVFVREQHLQLEEILERPEVVALLGRCGPITVPTHSTVPVVRFHTGLDKGALEASINQTEPPSRGLLVVSDFFNFEPDAARSTSGVSQRSARRWWSNYPLAGFERVAENDRWAVYARCG